MCLNDGKQNKVVFQLSAINVELNTPDLYFQ